ncbi:MULTISPECIES: TetR/AcrR family transcriptional regulator [Sphingobium]|jgi:TetR/AcrR family transcriptional repressor of uid operon|uniref:Transcriptional regulator n=1 Tax=Sphingobium baderi TaxID=1332080 RepID=A0A0S3F0V0_9SPHN|nr:MULTISPECIES: TetR/AcrR family transcriptional regulator [Sphingobium]ALR21268.1 transcriptional regulator [Sphingobium baderi]
MVAVQQERSGREHILNTARDLFSTHGFHQTSMAELATAAKVSVGQIYRLFKGKEDIIEALIGMDMNDRIEKIDILRLRLKAGEIDIEQTFEHLFLLSLRDKDEALSFDILAEALRNRPVGETVSAMCQQFRRFLRDFACIANPHLSGEALDGAEEVILASIFGMGHRSLSLPNLSNECTARRAAQMIVAALKATR